MNLTKYKLISVGLTFLLIFIHSGYALISRNLDVPSPRTNIAYPRIEWVSSWPSLDKKRNTKNFEDRINSLLFGTKLPDLSNPVSVLASSPDDFWVLDQGNKTIFQVQKGVGDIPHQIMKSGFDLNSIVGVCSESNNEFLFTDSRAEKIYRYSAAGKRLQVVNETLVLEQPTGIAFSPSTKEIWVVETKAHRVSVLNERGELVRSVGKRGTAIGEFNFPTHIWIDKKGNVYINDSMNFRIQVMNLKGEIISVFGEAGDASGYFARPKGIATDSHGNIYVVDGLFNTVQVFDIKGTFLYKFGSQGHGEGEFWMPNGIFIDDQDHIYVADTYNSRVQIFNLITESK